MKPCKRLLSFLDLPPDSAPRSWAIASIGVLDQSRGLVWVKAQAATLQCFLLSDMLAVKASNHCHNQYHEQLEVQHVCSQGWPSQNKSLGCQCLEAPSLFSEVSFCCTTKKGEIDGYFLESKSARSGEEKQLTSFWKEQSSFPKYWRSFCAFGISTTYWHISLLGFDFGWLGEVCVNLSLTRQTSRTLGTKFNQTASFTSSPKYQEAKE